MNLSRLDLLLQEATLPFKPKMNAEKKLKPKITPCNIARLTQNKPEQLESSTSSNALI